MAAKSDNCFAWASISSEWDLVERVVKAADRVYIYGDPGLGKSYAALHFDQNGDMRRIISTTLNEDLSVQELMGFWAPNSEHGVKWIDGPMIEAVRKNCVLVINELHRASAAVQDFLLCILDNNESAVISLPSGETLQPAKDFKVIATSNEPPSILSEALVSRFDASLHVVSPNPRMVESLNKKTRKLGELVSNSFSDKKGTVIQPRKALSWAKLVNERGMSPEAAAVAVFGDEGSIARDFIQVLTVLQIG